MALWYAPMSWGVGAAMMEGAVATRMRPEIIVVSRVLVGVILFTGRCRTTVEERRLQETSCDSAIIPARARRRGCRALERAPQGARAPRALGAVAPPPIPRGGVGPRPPPAPTR